MEERVKFISEEIAKGNYTLSGQRKGRSLVWNVLAEIQESDETILEGFVYCRNCSKVLKYTAKNTSNLCRHKCCKDIKESQFLKTVSDIDKNEAIDKCSSWVIEDCRPFSTVHGSGFVKLVKFFIKIGAKYGEHVNVEDLLPDATTISRKVKKDANEKKQELKDEIKSVVNSGGASATIDMWTDNYIQRNFLGVTFHYQKDFKFFDLVLGMKSLDFERATGDNIMLKLQSLFNEFDIKNINKIKFITDRGANIIKALSQTTRLNCSSHLFSNVLDKSFAETIELHDILESCKKIVKYFKKANLQHLLPTSLKSQCPTRWNSNYRMFKSVTDNWFAMNNVLNENDQSQRMRHIDIFLLKALVEICKDFEVVFKTLQVCSAPSLCYVLPSIIKIKSICEPNIEDAAAIAVLKENIKKNIDDIWVVNLSLWHKAAYFLYPPAINTQSNDLETIKTFCVSCIQDNEISPCTPQSTSAVLLKSDSSVRTTSLSLNKTELVQRGSSSSSDSFSHAQFFFSNLFKTRVLNAKENPESEVNRYCGEIVEMTENFNLMEWWQTNQTKYPRLSKLALQLHSMPASSAAAERSFSLAGNIISEKRNRLGKDSVDSLLFLNSFYKNFSSQKS